MEFFDLRLTKINRQFGAWLLSKVDPKTCAIVIDTHKEIPFSSNHVNIVFGLPCSGKAILPCSLEEVDLNKSTMCELFVISLFSKVTIPFLEGIMKKQYSRPMTSAEERSIKAAFVLYVVAKLLAPQSLANNISTRYIGAVADVDNIMNYNWSQFVVYDLKKSVELMPKRFPKSSQGSINGCILFLQAQGLINEAVADAYGEFSIILDDISYFVNICDNKTMGEAL